jgi:DNA repair protein RecN (Recombination protein N)
MIERIYIKENLSIKETELEFSQGLMVFSGSSGAGKSVLMSGILSVFGLAEAKASLGELNLRNVHLPEDFESDDEIVIKQIKKEKVRYFINGQSVSKSRLKSIGNDFLMHLHHKDESEFRQENLIKLLDTIVSQNDKGYEAHFKKYQEKYSLYIEKQAALQALLEKEQSLEELKEFARFEIDKITTLNPIEGEEEGLMQQKKMLSKKDKIEQLMGEIDGIFAFESAANQLFEFLDVPSDAFNEAMNDLRSRIEEAIDMTSELNELDIESLLDRIEKISEMTRRYGSISEAILYKEQKEGELAQYEGFDLQKKVLESEIETLFVSLNEEALVISTSREAYIPQLNKTLSEYLEMLYMPDALCSLEKTALSKWGGDTFIFATNHTALKNLSSGEFNRMRLALLATKVSFNVKSNVSVLFLDEIDANLSGEESASVAKVLKFLSQKFQIFAISHQAQLTSSADIHFLVSKPNDETVIKALDKKERIAEIARIISGEEITKEAMSYAKKLFK